MIKEIFGKSYQFVVCEELKSMLSESVELYSNSSNKFFDVEITIVSTPEIENKVMHSRNPSLHSFTYNGMSTKLNNYDINWRICDEGKLRVTLLYTKRKGLKHLIRKYRGGECSTEVEVFEQVLHELVLVPSLYFFDDRMPVHASTVKVKDKTVMFAGTGGVGKSSAMLAARELPSTKFIADDIVALTPDGVAYGNMAWPKIYGYNCIGTEIADLILDNRGWQDKLHFKMKNRINPTSVRRKIKPNLLYPLVSNTGDKIDIMYVLFKENVEKITVSDLSNIDAQKMSIHVMEAEYYLFHNHLHWHAYNAIGCKETPIISLPSVKDHWGNILDAALPSLSIKKISIPLEIKHEEYLEFVKLLLSQE